MAGGAYLASKSQREVFEGQLARLRTIAARARKADLDDPAVLRECEKALDKAIGAFVRATKIDQFC
jgi:hypothetical protein